MMYVIAMRHAPRRPVVEEPIILRVDEARGGIAQLRKRRAYYHQAGRQPRGVDERDQVTAALERSRVVVVEKEAGVGFELFKCDEKRA